MSYNFFMAFVQPMVFSKNSKSMCPLYYFSRIQQWIFFTISIIFGMDSNSSLLSFSIYNAISLAIWKCKRGCFETLTVSSVYIFSFEKMKFMLQQSYQAVISIYVPAKTINHVYGTLWSFVSFSLQLTLCTFVSFFSYDSTQHWITVSYRDSVYQ